jgi:hypothetical protein
VIRGGPYLIMEELPFSTLTRGADSNPARVLSREGVARLKIFIIIQNQIDRRTLSIKTHVLPVQIIPALNREVVELQFNQSYQFELTTNPLGKHYINS